MKKHTSFSKTARKQQGITLVTTLLLLMLLMGMSLTMVLAVSSESLINGFYGRSKYKLKRRSYCFCFGAIG